MDMHNGTSQKARYSESSRPPAESSVVSGSSLEKIAAGTGLVFIGSIAGLGLAFLGRVLVARFFTQAEFGIYSLGYTILWVCFTVSLIGLHEGTARQIAYYRGKDEPFKVKEVALFSIRTVLATSLLLLIVLFFVSDILSVNLFHEPTLATPLKILAFTIPGMALMEILVAIFRGFNQVKEKVFFQDILRNVLFPLFLLPVIYISLPFIGAIYAFTASIVVAYLVLAIYSLKKAPIPLRGSGIPFTRNPLGKELLLLSLPLLGVYFLNQIIGWTDTLMLGFFKTSDYVGLYNAAIPLARLTSIGMVAISVIYIPVTANFFSKNLMPEIRKNYEILTKWILFFTLPLVILVGFFPEAILQFIFGQQYVSASPALRILVLGFATSVVLGPCGQTLLSMGRTNMLMVPLLVGAGLNIVLNALLIPPLGIVGAAMASAISIALAMLIQLAYLYKVAKIHPFYRNYWKPLLPLGITVGLAYFLTREVAVTFWMLPVIGVMLYIIYLIFIFGTKSIDKEDIMLVAQVESKTGLNLSPIKRALGRYSHDRREG